MVHYQSGSVSRTSGALLLPRFTGHPRGSRERFEKSTFHLYEVKVESRFSRNGPVNLGRRGAPEVRDGYGLRADTRRLPESVSQTRAQRLPGAPGREARARQLPGSHDSPADSASIPRRGYPATSTDMAIQGLSRAYQGPDFPDVSRTFRTFLGEYGSLLSHDCYFIRPLLFFQMMPSGGITRFK